MPHESSVRLTKGYTFNSPTCDPVDIAAMRIPLPNLGSRDLFPFCRVKNYFWSRLHLWAYQRFLDHRLLSTYNVKYVKSSDTLIVKRKQVNLYPLLLIMEAALSLGFHTKVEIWCMPGSLRL